MPTYIALLRGINVGGHNRVPMADLREMLESIGCADVTTLLQSGNAVFTCGVKSAPAVETRLEKETAKRFKLDIDYFVRTPAEWKAVIEKNPFADEAKRDPSHLLVMFFDEALKVSGIETLRSAIAGPERIEAVGRQLYIAYPKGIGTSKLTNTLIERKLGARGTARNWNTVLKLGALAKAPS